MDLLEKIRSHDAHLGVSIGLPQGRGEALQHGQTYGVQAVGPVERYQRDPGLGVGQQHGVGHRRSLAHHR